MADTIDTTTQEAPAATEAAKTFTQAELNAHIETRLARERKEAAEKTKAAVTGAVTEAQRLAKMSADERAVHEREANEAAMKEREQGITKRELRAQALELLGEKGLPRELADVLPYIDADTTMAMLESVEKVFRAAVQKGVEERLKSTAPKIGQTVPAQSARDKLIAEYNAAEKAGNTIQMIALDARIKQLKE